MAIGVQLTARLKGHTPCHLFPHLTANAMPHKTLFAILILAITTLSTALSAQAMEPPASLQQALEKYLPGEKADSIQETPVAGVYEVVIGAQLFYLSGDGRYMFKGDIIDIPQAANVTENRKSEVRKVAMAEVDQASMIVYAPETTKHTISVFTDIDCGYCRKLHQELDQYLGRGIAIQYLLYPRGGKRAAAYDKSVSVWCSDDRQATLTSAKQGDALESKRCDNPVGDHMVLAREFGITGTPTIVLSDGSIIPGYVPADRLEKILEEIEKN